MKKKGRNFAFLIYPDSAPDDWVEQLNAKIGLPMAISPLHDKDKTEPMSDEAIRKWSERQAKKHVYENCPEGAIIDGKWLTDKECYKYFKDRFWAEKVKEQQKLPAFKKPHFHVLLVANNPLTQEAVVNKVRRALGDDAVSYAEIVDNIENYYLYLTHESADAKAKNKHVYDRSGIRHLHNFDVSRYKTLDKAQKEDMADKLYDFISDHQIDNFADLCDFVKSNGSKIGFGSFQEFRDVYESHACFFRDVINGIYQRGIKRRNEAGKEQTSGASETP